MRGGANREEKGKERNERRIGFHEHDEIHRYTWPFPTDLMDIPRIRQRNFGDGISVDRDRDVPSCCLCKRETG